MLITDDIWQVSEGFEDLDLTPAYLEKLHKQVEEAYATSNVFPPKENMLLALRLAKFSEIKVVVLGQDPYPTRGDAMGLAFSVNSNQRAPKSLINIVTEMNSDLRTNLDPYRGRDLSGWARQGVLLLNTILTVEEGKPLSHKSFDWEIYTDAVIKKLNEAPHPLVYILWGANAQAKIDLIDQRKNHIIRSPHPSPLSAYRGFFGSHPFSRTNQYLINDKLEPIDWTAI